MMIILGCVLVICYNRVPAMHMNWSNKILLGNSAVSDRIFRNRFQKIFAKIYFADPKKPRDATKTYYLDENLAYLKSKFISARSECTYQFIDQSMPKFKGRSSLKQYMPLKPIKRGISFGQDAMLDQVMFMIPIFTVEKKLKKLKKLLVNALLKNCKNGSQ